MAIFGIGATYGKKNVADKFINNNVVCIGWSNDDAPTLHEIFKSLKVGDIVYIKSTPIKSDFRIKAVGIITDNTIQKVPELGTCIKVRWLWNGLMKIPKIKDKYNVTIVIYSEF